MNPTPAGVNPACAHRPSTWTVRVGPDVNLAELDDAQFKLWVALERYARSKPDCWPSNARLAADCGWSVSKVGVVLRSMELAGLISRDQSEGRTIRLERRLGGHASQQAPPSESVIVDPGDRIKTPEREMKDDDTKKPDVVVGPIILDPTIPEHKRALDDAMAMPGIRNPRGMAVHLIRLRAVEGPPPPPPPPPPPRTYYRAVPPTPEQREESRAAAATLRALLSGNTP